MEEIMVSPELLRRYPFFSGLSLEEVSQLAQMGEEITIKNGHYFFKEGETLDYFYLNVAGAIAIVMQLPAKGVVHSVSKQYLREYETSDVVVSTVGPGEIFGWSGMIEPFAATAAAKATTDCRVVHFNRHKLWDAFNDNYHFGYVMSQKAAQVIRDRLKDLRIESLAALAA
jgi:CRP/FNR family transcriptional regulator, cyclic AMP receptor protein